MLYRAPFFLCYEKEEGVASLGNGWRVSGVTQKVKNFKDCNSLTKEFLKSIQTDLCGVSKMH